MLRTTAAILIALSVTACAKKTPITATSIVGTWVNVHETQMFRDVKSLEFGKGGEYRDIFYTEQKGPPIEGSLKSVGTILSGTYRVEGGAVIISIKASHTYANGEQIIQNEQPLDSSITGKASKMVMVGDALMFEGKKGSEEELYHRGTTLPSR